MIAALQSLSRTAILPTPRDRRNSNPGYLRPLGRSDIEAETPLAAAQRARHYQTKFDTTAQVFDVFAPLYGPPEPCGPSMRVARIDLTRSRRIDRLHRRRHPAAFRRPRLAAQPPQPPWRGLRRRARQASRRSGRQPRSDEAPLAVYVGVLTSGEPRKSSHQHGLLTLTDHRR